MARVMRIALLCLACLLPLAATAGPNQAPIVSLTSPTNGATFTAPATITLTASASDPDGTVAKVEFYRGGTTLIGTATAPPYTITWSNVATGSYSLTAKATDNLGKSTTSTAVSIAVTAATNQPPTVSLTAPSSGATYTAPASISLAASASDPDGTVSKVEFFSGSTLLATATTPPYTYTWSGVAAGAYTLTAKATDNSGAATTSSAATISVGPANVPPLVAITAPTNCGPFDPASAITLQADAVDPDGTVTKVEFYQGSTLIGTVANPAPYADPRNAYALNWSGMSAGTYSITAKAYDNKGASTTSTAMTVTVSAPNQPPSVSITAPAAGAVYATGSNIVVSATASDTDDTVARVDFYAGSTLIGSSTSAPYSVVWNGVAAGNYSLTAVATDSRGASTTSAAVLVSVNSGGTGGPLTVSLAAPTPGGTYYTPAAITLTAAATSTAGTISQVQFYQGTTLLTTVNASPYSFTWSGATPGTYSITAKATDSAGNVATSPAAGISVAAPAVTYLHDDLLGSPIAATDAAGNVLWRETYEPYGKRVVNATAASGNRQFYTGKPLDAETGWGYFGARYYDPAIGRFLGVDAVDFIEGKLHTFNRYVYANNNPYRYVDPDGAAPITLEQLHQVNTAIQAYQACGSANCISASLTAMIGVRNELKAAGVDPIDRSAINANIGQASGLVADLRGVLDAAGGGGIIGLTQGGDSLRNGHLAGGIHPKTGIPFDKSGFPDFSGVAKAEVKIRQTGTRAGDFRAANEAAGFSKTPEGYTWHHHQDGTTMQLVPRDTHAQTGHTGGFNPDP